MINDIYNNYSHNDNENDCNYNKTNLHCLGRIL